MNTKVESRSERGLDTLKWLSALLILSAAVVGFYYFSQESLLLRVVALLVCIGIGIGIVLSTEKGRFALEFIRDTRTEVRKVVWPSRQETIQTTGVVIFMVILIALMIWLVDSILFWIVQKITA